MAEKQNAVGEIRTFNRFYTNIIGVLDRHILESPHSLSEARILFEINAIGPCSARDVNNIINMDEGYLSRIIDKFVSKKILKKSRSKDDARVFDLSLTPKGKATFDALSDASEREIKKMIHSLSKREVDDLLRNMRRIKSILSKVA